MALVVPHLRKKRIAPAVTLLAVFGASLLYGDGVITPAISILSAAQGMRVAAPHLHVIVLPLTIAVIIGLFIVQPRGIVRITRSFSPVMLVWFITLAVLGAYQIAQNAIVVKALWPGEAVSFFVRNRGTGFLVLGSVFLVITGAEALYADMGQFGREPIRLAWFSLVLPSLVFNYFGQGALLLRDPTAVHHPFFAMAPAWALYPLIVLSLLAAVVTSQAVINGAFALTWQAVQMGFLPRVHITHTTPGEGGQGGRIYIGAVNWILMFACIALVLHFQTTEKMANAYGVAVTTDMIFTTLLIAACAHTRWNWSFGRSVVVGAALLAVDLPFWLSNLTKIPGGGYVSLLIAVAAFMPMVAWKMGRNLLAEQNNRRILPVEDAIAMIAQSKATRVKGIAVFMSRHELDTPATLLHNLKHNKVVHEYVVLLTIKTSERPTVPLEERVTQTNLGTGFYRIILSYGFTDRVDVPASLRGCSLDGRTLDLGHTTYFLGRETLIVKAGTKFLPALWKRLFVGMSRNAESAMTFFHLPPRRVVELGAQIEI
jgi:KUP system potassium uptake protein